uniref:Protein NATD1 n=1 Tax=Anopheles atroparvus TaxID=41427 RepID=A0AAG5DQH6_ANOAO
MSCMLFARTVAMRISGTRRLFSSNVTNDLKRSKFYINVEKTNEAYLRYSIDVNHNVINLEHTFVPDAGKGKGIGKMLAQAAFQYAIEHNLKVKLECDFTVKYYRDNETKYKEYVLQ